jgi:hypothetical protein
MYRQSEYVLYFWLLTAEVTFVDMLEEYIFSLTTIICYIRPEDEDTGAARIQWFPSLSSIFLTRVNYKLQ